VLPYAAYLRVYEPLTAFPEPVRSVWESYAGSAKRPRRVQALGVEHAEAVRRLIAAPVVIAPSRESSHAYVRRSGDMIYICPWQTRLRSWLAFSRFRAGLLNGMAGAFVPGEVAERVEDEFERWKLQGPSLHPHIQCSTWQVPLGWFVPFDHAERILVLDAPAAGTDLADHPEDAAAAPAAPTRTLIYVAPMAAARTRLTAALKAVRGDVDEGPLLAQIETVAEWLHEFSPQALVELDYGGLVHLRDDEALRADESVAEMSVALAAMARGEAELAVAMYKRLLARWRVVRALETAN
jgi:hypothetical protein